jgi:hypothetical protein
MIDERARWEALEKRELAGFIKPLGRYVWSIEADQSFEGLSSVLDNECSAVFRIPSLPDRTVDF